MPDLPHLFSGFPFRTGILDGIRVPVLNVVEALPYASLRPIGRSGRDPVTLPPGVGVIEVEFEGDIGVFEICPQDGKAGPSGDTRGHFLRLYVPLDGDGRPNHAAAQQSLSEVEERLNFLCMP